MTDLTSPLSPTATPVLSVENLNVAFRRGEHLNRVVSGVSFSLHEGRCLAIVGESGSGKSVTARTLVGLAGPTANVEASRLQVEGRDVRRLGDREWRALRGKQIGFILQDALVSLDGLRQVGREIGEGPKLHGEAGTRAQLSEKVIGLLKLVGVPEPALKARQLPHELSGGQRQRALIASALALAPKILIADEPTTALDVTVQAQVLAVLEEALALGKSIIIISHDLAVVSRLADDVIVMRGGIVVESGAAAQVFSNPQHEYTKSLLAAVPSARSRGQRLAPAQVSRIAFSSGREAAPALTTGEPLLKADRLSKRFRGPDRKWRTVVNDVSFLLHPGETLGIVGESGSGKSTLARLALALETPDEGSVHFQGQPWTHLTEKQRRPFRRNMSVIYQDPLSSFDPRWTVERILDDSLTPQERSDQRSAKRVLELLDNVGLAAQVASRRPLELSGGQRQRVAIARAIATRPALIVCDEPVSALDVSIQAQILDLLGDLKAQLKVSYLFISHDLGVVHHLSDRVMVMKDGHLIEHGDADDVLLRPQSDYTRQLIAAMPRLRHQPAELV